MTRNKDAERLAQLEAEVAALKAAQPKPAKSAAEREREIAEWQDQMHQMRERRMSMAMPPSVVRYFSDGVTAADCADIARVAHAPTGPASAVPGAQQRTGGGNPQSSPTPGWSDPRPLTNPPGTNWVDAIAIADDVRQRSKEPKP
jgi:hypothetical protein